MHREAFDCVIESEEEPLSVDDLALVWFNYTLRNWKAMVARPGVNVYWEVTYNDSMNETYVHKYVQQSSSTFSYFEEDDEEEMGG